MKSPWILKVSMALGNCVVASTQKIAENLKVCRDHTLFSGTRDLQTLLPNQVTSRQKGFQKSYLLYRDRLCMAAINSESFWSVHKFCYLNTTFYLTIKYFTIICFVVKLCEL